MQCAALSFCSHFVLSLAFDLFAFICGFGPFFEICRKSVYKVTNSVWSKSWKVSILVGFYHCETFNTLFVDIETTSGLCFLYGIYAFLKKNSQIRYASQTKWKRVGHTSLRLHPNPYQALNKDGTFDFNNIFFLLFDSLFCIDSKKLKLFSFLFHES